MRKLSVWDAVAVLVMITAAIATWTVYDRLPDPIPTHFDLHGTPNGWMSRPYGAWFMPAFALVMWALVRGLPSILPKKDKQRMTPGSVPVVAMLITIFLAAVHIIILYVALTPHVQVTRLVFIVLGMFLVSLGLIMPRLRRNPIIGVRTPWTLTSDENWARTHRVAGYSMVTGGALTILCAMIGGMAGTIAALVCILGSSIVPAVWSLLYARRVNQ